MNKTMKTLVIVATLVIAFGAVGSVYAQSGGPGTNGVGVDQGFGNGFRGGLGESRNQSQGTAQGAMDGVLHDAWMVAYAESLGMTVDALEAEIAAGKSMLEIAQSEGLTVEEFWALKMEVRAIIIDQAVSDGTLTQEKADWMKTRGAGAVNGQGKRGLGLGDGNCPND